jgi:hypothetical protein
MSLVWSPNSNQDINMYDKHKLEIHQSSPKLEMSLQINQQIQWKCYHVWWEEFGYLDGGSIVSFYY